ncbi:hypothetical protein AB0L59_26505 [Streptomyces sp. NPDC052109]|uniref:hypothetical protein n=1 Tax=Streptomyces sp. NPDC052109 TaxID=3155527 RepID=UPI003448E5C3
MAALDGDRLAYLAVSEWEDDKGRFREIGVIDHGPGAAELADQVATEIGDWERGWGNSALAPASADSRRGPGAVDGRRPRFVIAKTCSRLVIDWPGRS